MTAPADPRALALIAFISRDLLRGREDGLGPDTPLVSSGLLDSFALVELLQKLEDVCGRRLAAGRLGPAELETVRGMLAVVDGLTS